MKTLKSKQHRYEGKLIFNREDVKQAIKDLKDVGDCSCNNCGECMMKYHIDKIMGVWEE